MPIADIDYREYFAEDKLDVLSQAFQQYDVNNDGRVSEAELYSVFKTLGYKLTRTQFRDVVKEVEFDGSGTIEFEELCVLEIKMSRARPRADLIDYLDYLDDKTVKKLETLFVQQDPLQNGFIGFSQLARVFEGLDCKPSQQEVALVLSQIDAGCNGASKGELDFDKLCSLCAILLKGRKQINYREFLTAREVDGLRQMFAAADSRGEGVLTSSEFGRLLKKLGMSLKKQELSSFMKRVDTDSSGDIDFEEFCIMMIRLRQLRRKRSIRPDTCSCSELWLEENFSVQELLRSRFTVKEFRNASIPVGKIYRDGGFSALELRRAGYSPAELRRAGVGLAELRNCGFSLADLRNAGFSNGALAEANRALQLSLSTGDLSMLPQQRPPDPVKKLTLPSLTTPSKGLGSSPLIAASASLGSLPSVIPPRQMTPMIREHTDWRPKLRRSKSHAGHVFGVAGADIMTTTIPEGQCAELNFAFPEGPR